MEKVLILRKEHEIKDHETGLKEVMPVLQKVVDEFNKLGINVQVTPGLLSELFSKTRNAVNETIVTDFIKSLMIDSDTQYKVGNIPISKEKLIGLIDAPDIKAFMEAFSAVKSGLVGADGNGIAFSSFDIVDNKVQINQKQLDRFNSDNTFYAETKGEIECAKIIMTLCDALNVHHKAFKLEKRDAIGDPPRGVRLNDEGLYVPDINDIRRFGPSFEKK
jgi:hypothetical protein